MLLQADIPIAKSVAYKLKGWSQPASRAAIRMALAGIQPAEILELTPRYPDRGKKDTGSGISDSTELKAFA